MHTPGLSIDTLEIEKSVLESVLEESTDLSEVVTRKPNMCMALTAIYPRSSFPNPSLLIRILRDLDRFKPFSIDELCVGAPYIVIHNSIEGYEFSRGQFLEIRDSRMKKLMRSREERRRSRSLDNYAVFNTHYGAFSNYDIAEDTVNIMKGGADFKLGSHIFLKNPRSQ